MLTEKEKQQAENIEIRSYEVQELLGQVPGWIIRWGITLTLSVMGVLLLGSWFFKYPEIHTSEITLTTEVPAVELIAKTSGKIQKLFVADSQKIEKNKSVAVIETAADYNHVLQLEGLMDSVKLLLNDNRFYSVKKDFSLGEIQSVYGNFLKLYRDYQMFLELGYYDKKIEAMHREQNQYFVFKSRLADESELLRKEFNLAYNQFTRDSLLYIQGVTSSSDFEKAESEKLSKELRFNETRTNLANAQIEIAKLEQQILDLQLAFYNENKQKKLLLDEAVEKLLAEIKLWKQKHLLSAPLDGIVSFTKFWSENQNVIEGEPVITIIPENPGEIIGKIKLSTRGAGKVKIGQQVIIKFENYPYMEFGTVRGYIHSISLVPNEDFYIAEVRLQNGMITNYGNTIDFKQNMPGRAEIITENMNLLRKIFNPVRSVLKEQKGYKNN